MNDEPVARITLDEIYRETLEVKTILQGMAEREKAAVARVDSLAEDVTDHETRIRVLEKWKYAIPATSLLVIVEVIRSIVTATS